MAPANKGKGKGRESRPSRSRNTTPSSGLSSGPTVAVSPVSYLENDPSKLLIPTSQYAEILDRMGGAGPIPDSKSLESLVEHLKSLSQMADARGDTCNMGIRELSQKRKDVAEEPEPIDREATRMKREMDEDEDLVPPTKGGKLKKRKERGGRAKEERPLNHGAHELGRQDGGETKVEGGKSVTRYGPPLPILFSNYECSKSSVSHHTDLTQRLLRPRRSLRMQHQRAPLRFPPLLPHLPYSLPRIRMPLNPKQQAPLRPNIQRNLTSPSLPRRSRKFRFLVRIRSSLMIRLFTTSVR